MKFINSIRREFRLAFLKHERRFHSIKHTNPTTYDRYDPAYGLHKPYEVKAEK